MVQKARPGNPVEVEEKRAAALTAAGLEAARLLGLDQGQTATVLGVPAGALKAMREGKRSVDGYSGEAEAADALVRIVKRLQALLGADQSQWRSWLRRECEPLDSRPLELMLHKQGAVKVAGWLERAGRDQLGG